MSYHDKSIAQVFVDFDTGKEGLPVDRVVKEQQRSGKNVLPTVNQRKTKALMFFAQFLNPLMIVLVIAGLVSLILHEYADAIVIGVTVVLNAIVGFVQEYKADAALQKLQQMVTFQTTVIRGGTQMSIPSEDIVPGDLLIITAGEKLQADGRLIEAFDLEISEAVLTGESVPVKKRIDTILGEVSLADRVNMAYRGTTVVNGRGKLIVTAIGQHTEVGRIASLVDSTADESTPLQQQLARLGKQLGVLIVCISILVIFLGLLRGNGQYQPIDLLRTAIAVAVAAVPEGLVISLTVILAIGMQQILKRKALVRKLVAAETLGSVSVICTDKTGTLTEGVMKVTNIHTYEQQISQKELGKSVSYQTLPSEIALALRIAVMCNDVIEKKEGKHIMFLGDTTEVALAGAGLLVGMNRTQMEPVLPRIAEIPFSSERMYMATVHAIDHESVVYVKGAPEVVMSRSTRIEVNGKQQPITKQMQQTLREEAKHMAERGLRVLAVAYTSLSATQMKRGDIRDQDVSKLVFVGLIGMHDPLRQDVIETFQIAKRAGIAVRMITGDHISTARAIGKQLGLLQHDDMAIEGSAIDGLSDDELCRVVGRVSVFARVSPQHKIRIVSACRANGDVVAMTGDGVNDAPALKGADIGVAVGSGTDVARETADLVLLNDSFSTIVAAVEEGRRIYQNIKKVVLYLLVGSLAEVLLVVGSIVAGLPIALLPAQILWINIVQETFPTMALAFDPGDKTNMLEPPRKKQQSLFDPVMKWLIVTVTVVTNIFLFGIFYFYVSCVGSVDLARTMLFAGLGIGSLCYLYSIRSERLPLWQTDLLGNRKLTVAIFFGIVMVLLAVYTRPLQYLLHTVPLGVFDWIVILVFSVANVGVIEAVKFLVHTYAERREKIT